MHLTAHVQSAVADNGNALPNVWRARAAAGSWSPNLLSSRKTWTFSTRRSCHVQQWH